jgi:outer membrane protein assembly factor BamB
VKWSYATGAAIYASPVLGADGVLYVASDVLYAFNTSNGDVLWGYTDASNTFFATPALANGTLYIGNEDYSVYAVNTSRTNAGSLVWKYRTGNGIYSSAACVGGNLVYVGEALARPGGVLVEMT